MLGRAEPSARQHQISLVPRSQSIRKGTGLALRLDARYHLSREGRRPDARAMPGTCREERDPNLTKSATSVSSLGAHCNCLLVLNSLDRSGFHSTLASDITYGPLPVWKRLVFSSHLCHAGQQCR